MGGEILYRRENNDLAVLPPKPQRTKLRPMEELVILLAHLLTTVARLLGPGGAKALMAENLLIKRQLPILTRFRGRAPNLAPRDRILPGFLSLSPSTSPIPHSRGGPSCGDTACVSPVPEPSHAPFLGGGVAVTLPRYLAQMPVNDQELLRNEEAVADDRSCATRSQDLGDRGQQMY